MFQLDAGVRKITAAVFLRAPLIRLGAERRSTFSHKGRRERTAMSRHVTFMTIDDAEHYTPAERAAIIAAYPEHEREARAKGVPVLGSGRIFPVPEEMIACEPFRLPRWWPRIGALDFGWDHPSAAVELAWDSEADVVYVTKAARASQQTPAMQALALKPWGEWLPWAWPRDGRRETLEGAGTALARQYAAHGLNMLGNHARFADGSVSVEAGLMEMLDRMQSGRFKVFSTLLDWFEEFRLYRRFYWDAVAGAELPAGLDYAVFDFAVNSGPGRAAKCLQAIVGATEDGRIGPATLGAVRARPADVVIDELCDARLAFLKRLSTWPTFGRGWSQRVGSVRAEALLLSVAKPPASSAPSTEAAHPEATPNLAAPVGNAFWRLLLAIFKPILGGKKS
ncbi:terminase family protein [Mesorhizobium abyssinicae]|uniref:Terminase family protein n=1 Tax=Mesorhizobium abyssinicae TaxID=1209958 RepID=A0ABU5AV21_9HYPH|nr:terminase family protein [Mesorhizobium abyssinicae]MDX8541061.1 terminase family protein [Mesorhizobium abyssinicae]